MIDGQSVFAKNDSRFPGHFDERTVGAARGDGNRAHRAVAECHVDDGVRFNGAGFFVSARKRADLDDVSGEHVAQTVETMDGDVTDGAACRERWVIDPRARTLFGVVAEL